MQLMNDTETREYVLSQDNRTLSVLISDSIDQRAFQCKLRMQQCSLPQICQCMGNNRTSHESLCAE